MAKIIDRPAECGNNSRTLSACLIKNIKCSPYGDFPKDCPLKDAPEETEVPRMNVYDEKIHPPFCWRDKVKKVTNIAKELGYVEANEEFFDTQPSIVSSIILSLYEKGEKAMNAEERIEKQFKAHEAEIRAEYQDALTAAHMRGYAEGKRDGIEVTKKACMDKLAQIALNNSDPIRSLTYLDAAEICMKIRVE
jgi:flagellar biosynthesis/type III secretory pathway protein FliH